MMPSVVWSNLKSHGYKDDLTNHDDDITLQDQKMQEKVDLVTFDEAKATSGASDAKES